MRSFLERLSSRKFLLALAVQIAAVVAIFRPDDSETLNAAATQIAGMVTLLLAALGYGKIEAAVDEAQTSSDE